MQFIQQLFTVFAKVLGLHPRPAAVTSGPQEPVTLTIEKSAVAMVGGGRRPSRLRGKAVRLTCSWQVTGHHGRNLVLRRDGDVPANVHGMLTTTAARIKKVGAGRRPENMEGLTVRVTRAWTVAEDRGGVVLLRRITE